MAVLLAFARFSELATALVLLLYAWLELFAELESPAAAWLPARSALLSGALSCDYLRA